MDDILTTSATNIQVEKVGANLAAEVSGVDFTQPLDDETFQAVNDALVEHQVIVFRDIDITSEAQMAFGRLFGELTVHPFSPNRSETPELIVFQNDEKNPPFSTDVWHSDETFREAPPMATCLRATDVPKVGGDTMFASMSAAYDGLSDRMKNLISGLEGIHDLGPFKNLFPDDLEGQKQLHEYQEMYPLTTHPVVREHPVSGRKVIFVNPQFTIKIKGMGDSESRHLLDQLFDLAKIPEYQYRHHWYDNTMVLWDNRSVQHYAVHDYWPQTRYMERVTIKGDKTFGPVADDAVDSLRTHKSPGPDKATVSYGGHAPKRQHLRD